ncbi:MAG: carboxylating nicotinate-nucleotide diphosphorylase [Phycisphaerales bacterium]|nr:carboxylating nicotinate-nucleotide diphosphorylase [Phycisphaerales bacterium]
MMPAPADINAAPLDRAFHLLNPAPPLRALFELAREEDLGRVGDVTTRCLQLAPGRVSANVLAREGGTIAGSAAAPALIEAYGGSATFEAPVRDGGRVEKGAVVGVLRGRLDEVLAIERPLLNLLCHLSGIASLTERFVQAVSGSGARIFDTRKTTPGWRGLEKYAVRCGGGLCHRLGLYDAVLVKDNHLAQVNSSEVTRWLSERLAAAREEFALRFVEVEVDSLAQLRAVLDCAPGIIDVILLDNMPPRDLVEAIKLRDARHPQIELEASGGVTLDSVARIAETGVDRIAVGALTHSAAHLDLGLDFA